MEQRSFKLNSDEVVQEHEIFEAYGITNDTFTERYRVLIRFLHESLRTHQHESPPPTHQKPKCPHFTPLHTGQFDCTHERENAPPKIKKKNIHLEHCERCIGLKQKQKIQPLTTTTPNTTNPQQQTKQQPKPTQTQTITTPHLTLTTTTSEPNFTPHPTYGLAEVNYMRSDGSFICPFSPENKLLFVYSTQCNNCKKENPQKHDTCIKLKRNLREEINLHQQLRAQSKQKQPNTQT